MTYNSAKYYRHSIRLRNHDYSRMGVYFITICAYNRECLFREIANGKMRLNEYGTIIHEEWIKTGQIRRNIKLDEWIIMPNHVHFIIIIDGDGRGTARRAPTGEQFGKPTIGTIPTIIRSFKSAVTKRINELRGLPGIPLWQRNYYDHIIRNEKSMNEIREYIKFNPIQWEKDELNPFNNNRKDMIK
jgi:putative transposase